MAKKKDWRSKPRKPAETKRTESRGLRLSKTEVAALKANAALAGQTVVDFVVEKCCDGPN